MGGSYLYEINVATGAATLVGSNNVFLDSLAINNSGKAYAADFIFTDSLYTINLGTGAATWVGNLGFNAYEQSGLSFDDAGTLWALTSAGKIYTLDTFTGAASFVAQVTLAGIPIGDFEGLAIPPVPEASTYALFGLGALGMMVVRRKRKTG